MARPESAVKAIALLIVAWSTSNPANASLIAAQDASCSKNEYVVGLTGRTGLWIDAVGPVCSGWSDRTFKPVPGRANRLVGGTGGGQNRQACAEGSAVSGWQVKSIITGSTAFADTITVQCKTLAPPHEANEANKAPVVFGGSNSLPRAKGQPTNVGRCPDGELATGLSVWTSSDGRSVTAVSMRCGLAPMVYTTMTSQPGQNGTVTYFKPELKLRDGSIVRLDACLEWAANCGKPAADAFCVSKGLAQSVDNRTEPNVGLTVVISNRRICNSQGCSGFAKISCGSAQ